MATDRDRRISERYLLGRRGRPHSLVKGFLDVIGRDNTMKKCCCACFELAWLKFECQYEDDKALASIKDKYGDEVSNIVEQVLRDWQSDPEHFGEKIQRGDLPFDAYLHEVDE